MSFEKRLELIRSGPDDCWIWPWAKTPTGYGHFRRNKLDEYAHRAAYELLVGPIPSGAELDHFRCDEPSCCNPAHLRPTMRIPHVRRHHAERTHCYRGHPLLPLRADTWKWWPSGARTCMQCYRGWNAVRWDPAAAAAYRKTGRFAQRS